MEVAVTKEHVKINSEIAESVKNYISVNEQIKELSEKQKELKKQKEEHELVILKFMEDNNFHTFDVGNKINFKLHTLKKNKKKVNKDTITDSLKEHQVSQYVIDTVIDKLYKEDPDKVEEIKKVKVSVKKI